MISVVMTYEQVDHPTVEVASFDRMERAEAAMSFIAKRLGIRPDLEGDPYRLTTDEGSFVLIGISNLPHNPTEDELVEILDAELGVDIGQGEDD